MRKPIILPPILGTTIRSSLVGACAPSSRNIAATGKSCWSGNCTNSLESTPRPAAIRLSQPSDKVRVPVSSRPIVCAVVGGLQRSATSAKVRPFALRTSRIRLCISWLLKPNRFFYFLQDIRNGKMKNRTGKDIHGQDSSTSYRPATVCGATRSGGAQDGEGAPDGNGQSRRIALVVAACARAFDRPAVAGGGEIAWGL